MIFQQNKADVMLLISVSYNVPMHFVIKIVFGNNCPINRIIAFCIKVTAFCNNLCRVFKQIFIMNQVSNCNHCLKKDFLVSSTMLILCRMFLSHFSLEVRCIIVPLPDQKLQNDLEFLLEIWTLLKRLL